MGAIAGTATGGFGMYVHDGSTVTLAAQPTISGDGGTHGELTIDGTTDATQWATVWGGTPKVEATTDLVLIKKD